MVIPAGDDPHPGTRLGPEILVRVGGHEQSKAQSPDLLAAARFRLARIVPTATPTSVFEGVAEERGGVWPDD